ncbi:MAG: glycyl-radical enzyme activating protein [Holdemanella sp.]|nr:glycyl-radical enzyme activating protein [Holdemanella sp.]
MINVSNIEKFATHDGPGIRTTIFLMGCPLHCPWCANPETWSIQSTLMHDENKCVSCKTCMHVCKQGAISFEEQFRWDATKCINCQACIDNCIPDALSMAGKPMEIEDVLKEVLKDKDYYEMSNGGVTISGGEPFVQYEEFKKLVKALKKEGLHVALETTGNYSLAKLKEIEPYIDLFLFDIKHIDKEKLYDVTGANLDMILTNFEYIANTHPEKIISRTPVIPTFNKDKETLTRILSYVASKHIKEANLLPYHPLGKNKWNQLHKEYTYSFKMMDKKELEEYIEIGKHLGLYVKIGG